MSGISGTETGELQDEGTEGDNKSTEETSLDRFFEEQMKIIYGERDTIGDGLTMHDPQVVIDESREASLNMNLRLADAMIQMGILKQDDLILGANILVKTPTGPMTLWEYFERAKEKK